MKKKLIFAIWILLFFGFVTVNCNAQSSINDQRIVGTWVCTSGGKTYTYVFNANGSGTLTADISYTLTYGISLGGQISIVYSDGDTDVFMPYFSPDGKTFLKGTSIYRKK